MGDKEGLPHTCLDGACVATKAIALTRQRRLITGKKANAASGDSFLSRTERLKIGKYSSILVQKTVLLVVLIVSFVALASLYSTAFVYDGGPTTDTFQPSIHIEGDIRSANGDALYREDDRVMGVKQYPFRLVAIYDGKVVGSGGAYPLTYSLNLFTQITTLDLWDKNIELKYGIYDEMEPQKAKLVHCTTINLQERFGNFERREAWIDLRCAEKTD